MNPLLPLLRLLLRFGWMYILIALAVQDGLPFDWLPSAPMCALLACLQVIAVVFAVRAKGRIKLTWRTIMGAAIVSAVCVQGLCADAGLTVTGWTFTFGLELAAMMFWQAARLAEAENTYGEIRADCVRGLLCMVLTGVGITLADARGLDYGGAPLFLYPALVGYALLAMMSLYAARRFAPDDRAPDRRGSTVDLTWLAGMGATAVLVTIAAVALNMVLSFDVAGAAGTTAAVLGGPASGGGRFIVERAAGVITAVPWLFHVIADSISGDAPIPKLQHIPSLNAEEIAFLRGRHFPHIHGGLNLPPLPHHHPHSGSHAWHLFGTGGLRGALGHLLGARSLIIVVAALATVALLAWTALTSKRKRRPLAGRIRRWLGSPLGRRGDTSSSSRSSRWPFHRRGAARLTSVREVYRAFLTLGSMRARPRAGSETGLEYGGELVVRWPRAEAAVDTLNALYMQSRYGLEADSAEVVARALDQLHTIEAASKRETQQAG